jgi:pre-mRNA cleavage complex 2 protein Pcf11
LFDFAHRLAFQAPPDQKLLALFLIDSIIKNNSSEGTAIKYRELFAMIIIPLFTHIFQEVCVGRAPALFVRRTVFECAHLQGDERLRLTMHKVRRSWTTDLFPISRLYGIDIKVHEIDPAWPVAPVSVAQQSASASESTPALPATHTVHVNPRFLQQPSKVRSPPATVCARTRTEINAGCR